MSAIAAQGIWKGYRGDGGEVVVLRALSFTVARGEFIVVYGASGSGKSTFLHILGGLDRPDRGDVCVDGEALYRLTEPALARYRNKTVGFVFQFYHLLPEFTAEENVMVPMSIGGMRRHTARRRAETLLARVGLGERRHHYPSALSGGEQQRVAIARALGQSPAFIFADEPTGNLDEARGAQIMQLLRETVREHGTTIVMVTHNPALMAAGDRRVELREGMLHEMP
ncbi:MAG: ABC transporter ATP-binding protein [Deltaproteobacteria bacterium]|nr:ABC transporter ATP-binding protein [Deltaproteobacteria bacterium]